ncbi:MAG: mandelate racemase/muconate lactonizing enzyme family protein [Saprospiraceae bacterium]|nr:mandelate racemase/muconate lactonizing enzyme family protein [Saprospiraceae bacterium]
MIRPFHTSRRAFIRSAAYASFSTVGALLPPGTVAAIKGIDSMKIAQIDTVRFSDQIRIGGGSGGSDGAEFCWIRLHTDTGIIGTGETYPFSSGELGTLKDYTQQLLGKDPRDIDGIWKSIYHKMAMRNAGGADMRMLSAINMAQMDILGQAAGLPLYRLLGGKTRSQVKVYNTTTDYWAINDTKMGRDTVKIVQFLLERGITCMKIYPFHAKGSYITAGEIEAGLVWIRQIRETAGDKMDICVDCWGRFDLPSAQRIAKALEPFNILYLEDVMLMNNPQSYAALASETSVPICMSETLATRYEYREFFEAKACDVVMFDLSWCGGITEAKKIADMADTYFIPVSPHTCGGPLLWFASIHLTTAVPNLLIMESNYWKYTHQFPYFINNVPVPEGGHVSPPEKPGLGAEIRPEIFKNGDAIVETIARL